MHHLSAVGLNCLDTCSCNALMDFLPFLLSLTYIWVLQKSQGNGPLNRLLMAAKRKYMDTELPPQESEGKVKPQPLASLPDMLTVYCGPQRHTQPWRLEML